MKHSQSIILGCISAATLTFAIPAGHLVKSHRHNSVVPVEHVLEANQPQQRSYNDDLLFLRDFFSDALVSRAFEDELEVRAAKLASTTGKSGAPHQSAFTARRGPAHASGSNLSGAKPAKRPTRSQFLANPRKQHASDLTRQRLQGQVKADKQRFKKHHVEATRSVGGGGGGGSFGSGGSTGGGGDGGSSGGGSGGGGNGRRDIADADLAGLYEREIGVCDFDQEDASAMRFIEDFGIDELD